MNSGYSPGSLKGQEGDRTETENQSISSTHSTEEYFLQFFGNDPALAARFKGFDVHAESIEADRKLEEKYFGVSTFELEQEPMEHMEFFGNDPDLRARFEGMVVAEASIEADRKLEEKILGASSYGLEQQHTEFSAQNLANDPALRAGFEGMVVAAASIEADRKLEEKILGASSYGLESTTKRTEKGERMSKSL